VRKELLQKNPLIRRHLLAFGRNREAGLSALETQDAGRNLRYGQNKIHQTGGDGALRHPVVFGFGGLLHDHHAAVRLNILDAESPV
jgi:hypothetical protein